MNQSTTEDDLSFKFFRYAEENGFLTVYDSPRFGDQEPPDPSRARLALDIIVKFLEKGKFITDRDEIKEYISERKENQETGSQDVFNKLFSSAILIPIRRVSGGNDDTLLIHGDVVQWFSDIINSHSDLNPNSKRLAAVMMFTLNEVSEESDRNPREIAQDAWLYSRMIDNPEQNITNARLAHEGKLNKGEAPDPNFLLSEYHVPESQWGGKYNQYILEGNLADAVSVQSKHLYKQSLEEQMSTLLTCALYHAGGFWELESDTDDDSSGLGNISFDEFRRYLMGLNRGSDPSEIPTTFPDQALQFDTEYGTNYTKTAVYYAIKNKRVSR